MTAATAVQAGRIICATLACRFLLCFRRSSFLSSILFLSSVVALMYSRFRLGELLEPDLLEEVREREGVEDDLRFFLGLEDEEDELPEL